MADKLSGGHQIGKIMPNYDFLNLSPVEFEELSRDLLQKHFSVYLESFTQGKDKGIDLRYSHEKNSSFIVQCKRYKDFNTVKANLKKEYEKVAALNPSRYVLTTSVGLTPANKDEIGSIFNGYIKTTTDIFGREDINNLLVSYSEVEKHHYKLWLSSVGILERILHADIVGRAEFEIEEIQRTIRIYVQNKSYSEAISLLNKHNYVVISGIPGIGKTTLAKMLCFQYVANNYELVVVSGDINEAEKLIRKGIKQVFYYDDFLGTNFLEAGLIKNEDKRLLRFIETINRSINKKIILTTREYILNQARIKYEILSSKIIDISKCIIDLSKYTKRVRAQILYNHLFFYEVPLDYIETLLYKKRYFLIINHPNYNPRAVEFMTKNIEDVKADDYFDFFIGNLNNPSRIWAHSFENQITATSRYVLYALLISNGETTLAVLENTFNYIIREESKKYNIPLDSNSFRRSMKELENTFIKSNSDKHGEVIITFQNPSIQDFLVNYLQENLHIVAALIESAPYFNQIIDLYNPTGAKEGNKVNLSSELVKALIKNVMKRFDLPAYVLSYSMSHGGTTSLYSKYTLSEIDKLFELSEIFDLNGYGELRKFVASKLNDAILNKCHILNTGAYLKLLEKVKDDVHLRKEAIVLYIDNMDDISAIDELEKLVNIFPEECRMAIEDMGRQAFSAHLKEIISSDIAAYTEYDEDLVDRLKSEIRALSSRYEIDSDYFDDLLQEKLDESEQSGEDDTLDDYSGAASGGGADDKYIEDLFGSLRQ